MITVTVPKGATPGTLVQVTNPQGGNTFQVTVPAGVEPGSTFQVLDPSAAQVIGAPAQQAMGGMSADIFRGARSVFIKQRMEIMELCGIEAKQHYDISVPQGEAPGQVFMHIHEESDCCERICCGPNRSLTLKLHQGPTKDAPVLMSMKKPFSCQGCCFLRPRFEVFSAAGEKVGEIDDPCRCCLMDQQVMNSQGSLLFRTNGTLCQAGMCCPCCAGVYFDVLKGTSKVAEIKKMPLNCEEVFLKTNRFIVDFNQVTDPVEKQMLFAAAMLLDLEYFEQQK